MSGQFTKVNSRDVNFWRKRRFAVLRRRRQRDKWWTFLGWNENYLKKAIRLLTLRWICAIVKANTFFKLNYHANSTDEELRQGCLGGNRRAREFFYRRYYGKLIGIPLRYTCCRDDANAVFNQALLRIFSNLDSYREEGSFQGWLSTIVFRTTMSYLRSKTNKNLTVSIDEVPFDPPVNGGIEEQHNVDEIYRHIQHLPDSLRSVFCLYVVDDFSHDEISKILGISPGNSRWRLNQARLRLRSSLSPSKQEIA